MEGHSQNHATLRDVVLTIVLAVCASAQFVFAAEPPLIAETEPLSPLAEQQKFHLPPGFRIDLFAAEPDIRKPLNMAFDARGRLWVSESVDYPFPAKDEASARDHIKILEDTDGDGRADRFTTYAEHITIPTGVVPVPGGAVVYSMPNLYRFIDDDGDDRADRRELLYGPFGHDDTHGGVSNLTWGFDGWIYSCHGFSNTSKVQGRDGHQISMTSGSTFRFRMDGSRVENVTYGQVNPFGLAFDALGNMFTADCHSRPVYQPLPGAWYPEFSKGHDGLGFGPEICDHDHGSTAIAGVVHYSDVQFPPEYRGGLFSGNVVTNRINLDRLEQHGATYKAVHQPDFLVSDDPWFRPVQMQLGPDGAIYIADFYNRIIGHYEVALTHPGRDRERGRIWRVFYAGPDGGNKRTRKIDLARAPAAELVTALGDSNLPVRIQAANQLVFRIGNDAKAPVRTAVTTTQNAFQKLHALWVLERLGGLDSQVMHATAKDADALVRVHVQRILGERKTLAADEERLVLSALDDPDAWVRRAGAQALARHPAPEHLEPLFELRRQIPSEDTHLLHTVRMAIRDQLQLPDSWARARQMKDRAKIDEILVDVAQGVHSEDSARFLLDYVRGHPVEPARLEKIVRHMTQYLPQKDLVGAFSFIKDKEGLTLKNRVELLKSFIAGLQERGSPVETEVIEFGSHLADSLLASDSPARIDDGLELVQLMKLTAHEQRIAAIASATSQPVDTRKKACSALMTVDPKRHVDLLGRILNTIGEAAAMCDYVAELLGRVGNDRAVDVLVTRLRTAPAPLAVNIAVALVGSQAGGARLIEEVAAGKASPQLLAHPHINRVLLTKLPDAKERVETLTRGLATPEQRIEQLMTARKAGYAKAKNDTQRGAQIFEKTCSVCHRVGSVGQKIAPDLDGIGVRGLDRLLEDTLDPSRNVDQAFRTTIIELDDGVTLTGLVREPGGAVFTLIDSTGKPVTVRKDEVKEQRLSNLSPMPSNIAEELPEQDFYDLLAFLLAQRPVDSAPAASGKLDSR